MPGTSVATCIAVLPFFFFFLFAKRIRRDRIERTLPQRLCVGFSDLRVVAGDGCSSVSNLLLLGIYLFTSLALTCFVAGDAPLVLDLLRFLSFIDCHHEQVPQIDSLGGPGGQVLELGMETRNGGKWQAVTPPDIRTADDLLEPARNASASHQYRRSWHPGMPHLCAILPVLGNRSPSQPFLQNEPLHDDGRLGGHEHPLRDNRAVRKKRAATEHSSLGREKATKIFNRMASRWVRGLSSLGESTKVPAAHAGTEAVAKSPFSGETTELSPAHADAEALERSTVRSDLQSVGSPLARPLANPSDQSPARQASISHQGSVKRRHAQVEPSEDPPLANPSDQNPTRQASISHQGSVKRRRVRVEASENPVSPLSVGPLAYQYPAAQVPTPLQGSVKRRRVLEEASEDPVSPPSVDLSAYQYPALQVPTPHQNSSRRSAAASKGSKSRVPDHEQLLIKQLVQEQIDQKNHTEDKWKIISKELKTRYDIERNFTSIKNFWSRYGREKFELDERKIKNPTKMITSTQNPADRKRAREIKKVSRNAAQRLNVIKFEDDDDGTSAAIEDYSYRGRDNIADLFARRQTAADAAAEGYDYGGSGAITNPSGQAAANSYGQAAANPYWQAVTNSYQEAVANPFAPVVAAPSQQEVENAAAQAQWDYVQECIERNSRSY
ncbi:MAG: hypothetical protein Q9214_004228 [Letrouitia sp. 1 TL-2023]